MVLLVAVKETSGESKTPSTDTKADGKNPESSSKGDKETSDESESPSKDHKESGADSKASSGGSKETGHEFQTPSQDTISGGVNGAKLNSTQTDDHPQMDDKSHSTQNDT